MPARLTQEVISEIRKLRLERKTHTTISETLGISRRSVKRHTSDIVLEKLPKTCSQCGQTEVSTTFYKKGLVCKQCAKANRKKHYTENRQYYIDKARRHENKIKKYVRDLKNSTPCADCDKSFPFYVMDFDHLENKEFLIAHAHNKKTAISAVQLEIDKCDIVCANCHRERTFHRRQNMESKLDKRTRSSC